MKRFMVDIETLGANPDSVILSIGIARFSMNGVDPGHEWRIDIADSVACGLDIDPETLDWWLQQPSTPWRESSGVQGLHDSMIEVCDVLDGAGEVWAKPPSFDLSIIRSALAACSIVPTWHWRSESCFRTLKRLAPKGIELPEREGVHHGALDDAIHQAREAVVILNAINGQSQ